MTVELSNYIDALWRYMQNNKKFTENRTTFSTENTRKLGEEIYATFGVDGLFDTMRALCDMTMYQSEEKYQQYYFTDLRELEFAWSGISDDFQC